MATGRGVTAEESQSGDLSNHCVCCLHCDCWLLCGDMGPARDPSNLCFCCNCHLHCNHQLRERVEALAWDLPNLCCYVHCLHCTLHLLAPWDEICWQRHFQYLQMQLSGPHGVIDTIRSICNYWWGNWLNIFSNFLVDSAINQMLWHSSIIINRLNMLILF